MKESVGSIKVLRPHAKDYPNTLSNLNRQEMAETYEPKALKNRAPILIYQADDFERYNVAYKDRIGGKAWNDMELAKRVIALVERE